MTKINYVKEKINPELCPICNRENKVKSNKLGDVLKNLCEPHYDALMEIQFDKEIYKDETL